MNRTKQVFLPMTIVLSIILSCSKIEIIDNQNVDDQNDLIAKDVFWMNSDNKSYLQITGNRITNWIRNEVYTGGFDYGNTIQPVVIGESLLIATDPDTIFLLKNDRLVLINWDVLHCFQGPGCMMYPVKNIYNYSLYEGQIPPFAWPPLRTDSSLNNDIQGEWLLVKVTTSIGAKEWNRDSIEYKLIMDNDSGCIFKLTNKTALMQFDYWIDRINLHFSPNFLTIDSLENIPYDTFPLSTNYEQVGSGNLSNGLDTLICYNQYVYYQPSNQVLNRNTYYFKKK